MAKKSNKEIKEWLIVYKILINFCQKVIETSDNPSVIEEHKRYMQYFMNKANELRSMILK